MGSPCPAATQSRIQGPTVSQEKEADRRIQGRWETCRGSWELGPREQRAIRRAGARTGELRLQSNVPSEVVRLGQADPIPHLF